VDGTIQNALASEEKTLVEQVLSLLQQLLASQGETEEQPMVAEAEDPNMEDPNQALEIDKAVINETGDTKAEDRLSNQTEITDAGIASLGKAIQTFLAKNQTVQKTNTNNVILQELKKLNATLTGVMKTQHEQEQFNQNLMSAMGITNEIIQKNINPPAQTNNKPFQGNDMALFAKEFATEIVKSLNMQQPQKNPETLHPFNQKKRAQPVTKEWGNIIDMIGKVDQRRVV
jgi:hypothetical protein